MLKQSSSRMKKVLSILLIVLFVVSMPTAAASTAGHGDRNGRPGEHDLTLTSPLLPWPLLR